MSKVILAGGSGFIGKMLADHFVSKGDEVVIFSRSPQADYTGVKSVYWDAVTLGEWVGELEGADAELIHNCGGCFTFFKASPNT